MNPWPWPAPVADDAAAHLVRGTPVPAIPLPTTANRTIVLSEIAERTALFVYPWTGQPGADNPPRWDDIPGAHGSTPGLIGVANLFTGFEGIGVRVLALSGQSTAWQQAFVARNRLPFEILSDEAGALRDALRLPTFETGGVRYLKRLTLILSKGIIERAFYPVHPPNVHPRELLAWMSATATYATEARLKPVR